MVLSNSYLKELQKFIKVPPEKKQRVLTNPVTIEKKDYVFSKSTKQKKIIFCGRIDNVKCPQRVLEVWEILSLKFSDWSLSFIGDGPDKDMLTYESQKRGLKNVSFEGFQNPVNYYKTASILVMTSDFEGFPLVLAECMSFGVIPCVYDSFPALHDILKDNYNGLIVEKEHEGFSAKKMANKLTELMISNDKLNNFALNAIESSKRYSMDLICKQWEHELNELI
jgi:glycosyltransferase involved in cell wall biosynthesis